MLGRSFMLVDFVCNKKGMQLEAASLKFESRWQAYPPLWPMAFRFLCLFRRARFFLLCLLIFGRLRFLPQGILKSSV